VFEASIVLKSASLEPKRLMFAEAALKRHVRQVASNWTFAALAQKKI
jgi:hypothetical protein